MDRRTFLKFAFAPAVVPVATMGADSDRTEEGLGNVIDATEFGAVGDGITDDSAAVQAAIRKLEKSGGGILNFPLREKGYALSSAIECRVSNVIIDGGGNDFFARSKLGSVFVFFPPSLESVASNSGESSRLIRAFKGDFRLAMYESRRELRLYNITIRNIKWHGTPPNQDGGRMAVFYSVDNVRILGCNLSSCSAPVEFFYCRHFSVIDNSIRSTIFGLFAFRSEGRVVGNRFDGMYIGMDFKGAYPGDGMSILDGYEDGHQYISNISVEFNVFTDVQAIGVQIGYYDNAGDDWDFGGGLLIHKRKWFGQVWGASISGNQFSIPNGRRGGASDNRAFRANINAKFSRFFGNQIVGQTVELMGAEGIDIFDNSFVGTVGDAAIVIRGVALGGERVNSRNNKVLRNQFSECQSTQVYISGGVGNIVSYNRFFDCAINASAIVIDDRTIQGPVQSSELNVIEENSIYKAAADYMYPIAISGRANLVRRNKAYGGWYPGAKEMYSLGSVEYRRAMISSGLSTTELSASDFAENSGDIQ